MDKIFTPLNTVLFGLVLLALDIWLFFWKFKPALASSEWGYVTLWAWLILVCTFAMFGFFTSAVANTSGRKYAPREKHSRTPA